MELDPDIHIVMHSVLFLKPDVTLTPPLLMHSSMLFCKIHTEFSYLVSDPHLLEPSICSLAFGKTEKQHILFGLFLVLSKLAKTLVFFHPSFIG